MTKLNSADKRMVNIYLNKYIQSKGPKTMSLKTYQRTVQWSDGYSFAEIALEEGVSTQTVNVSVKKIVEAVKEYARN